MENFIYLIMVMCIFTGYIFWFCLPDKDEPNTNPYL